MKPRGFIAAPLIGTLIFLVSIIVIINLSRAENAAIAETASDAYHNKLVSIVEIYRADLGSIFNIGLQRNIEYALTSQCWQNFISLSTQSKLDAASDAPTKYNGMDLFKDGDRLGTVDEEEERYYTCARTTELMREVVCIKNSSYLFGLPAWAQIISENTSFEGIKLQAANGEQFQQFIGYDESEITGATDLCKALVSNIEIDCKEFSKALTTPPNYRCCSSFTSAGECEPDSIIKGCENGNQFYVRISVQNQLVYGKFPRVLATDTAGNQIRAGAITDVDYDAPISYPFFKYLDAAFKFNHVLAMGSGSDSGGERGITEGSCAGEKNGGSGCYHVDSAGGFPDGDYYGPTSFDNIDAARTAYSDAFLGRKLKEACTTVKSVVNTSFAIPALSGEKITCSDIYSNPATRAYQDAFLVESNQCQTGSDGTTRYCSYIKSLNREVTFTDPDKMLQVKANAPNEFCWYSAPAYFPQS